MIKNRKNMFKNDLSDVMKRGLRNIKIIPFIISIGGVAFVFIYFYIKSMAIDVDFIRYLKNHLVLLLFGVLLFVCGGAGLYYIYLRSEKINPKYISWNKDGIYIINRKNEKEFLKWTQIKSIYQLKGKYDDYAFYIRGQMSPRTVNKEIGRELKEYYENLKYREGR